MILWQHKAVFLIRSEKKCAAGEKATVYSYYNVNVNLQTFHNNKYTYKMFKTVCCSLVNKKLLMLDRKLYFITKTVFKSVSLQYITLLSKGVQEKNP